MDLMLQLRAGKEVLKIIFSEMFYVAIEKAYYCCNLINADKPVFIYTDKYRLTRIIQNLISNSIKYTYGDINFIVSNPTNQVYIDTEHICDHYYRHHKYINTAGSRIEPAFADGNPSIIVTLSVSL